MAEHDDDSQRRSPSTALSTACGSDADALNNACFCVSLDPQALDAALEVELQDAQLVRLVRERCPHVFADRPVFVTAARLKQMAELVDAVEDVVARPGWREHALANAPALARHDPQGAQGVFFGYDFHLNADAIGLIEINTNAGGAMLNIALARAQRACCRTIDPLVPTDGSVLRFERAIVEMFGSEWRAARGNTPLRCVAIVDSEPQRQYLYPEFLLFQRLFERYGIRTVIAGPEELRFQGGTLHCGDAAIDLVYNRLTDFYLEEDSCSALRQAYLENAVVLTPHPQAHALYADKRRLADLTDLTFLKALGVHPRTQETLVRTVPRVTVVRSADAESLWPERRRLFFKPVSGYGGRAAYRGDKLTRRVWQEILDGDYVAQALVAPGERQVDAQDPRAAMKFDLRLYVYAGRTQWVAARMYQGQTTNFRTAGGGFAPVYSIADGALPSDLAAALSAQSSSTDETSAAPCRPGEHASFVFLLDSQGKIHPLPHELYVALARSQAAAESLADQSFRLADWYVRLHDGKPERVVNEWYGWVRFDAHGRFEAAAEAPGPGGRGQSQDVSALPTSAERERMESLLFSATAPVPNTAGEGNPREKTRCDKDGPFRQ